MRDAADEHMPMPRPKAARFDLSKKRTAPAQGADAADFVRAERESAFSSPHLHVIRDHQHGHEERRSDAGNRSDPDRRVGAAHIVEELLAGETAGERGDDGEYATTIGILKSLGPAPDRRLMSSLRTNTATIVAINPEMTASTGGSKFGPSMPPTAAPTAAATRMMMIRLADVTPSGMSLPFLFDCGRQCARATPMVAREWL